MPATIIGMSNEAQSAGCCAPARSEVVPVAPPQAQHDPSAANITQPATGDSSQIDFVHLPGGSFWMGTADTRFPGDAEGPIREVTLDAFAVSRFPVTVAQFGEFVAATGYVTDAEQFGWSFVFHHFVSDATKSSVRQAVKGSEWWWQVHGTTWRYPDGPDSSTDGMSDHPVVHVSWRDAVVYCKWASVRLPTEAEWEYAARGGLDRARYAWGDVLEPDGRHMCNIWQGRFPDDNTLADGFHGTSPVGKYQPNGFGLHDVAGNVWEWCADWWSTSFHRNERRATRVNPKGPRLGDAKVIRGGSYLCHESYCNRYRVGARTAATTDSSTGNMGFRVVRD